ncbi:MAG: carboxypeptidase-like regulatory domain-containing protein [Paludibacter sp.]
MNSKQRSFIATCRRISDFLKKFLTITIVLPTFTATQTEFDANLAQMEAYGEQQKKDIKGLRTKKEELKAGTGQKVLDMSHRIEAYAKITGDKVLEKKAHIAEAAYLKSSDQDFMSTNNIIVELAEVNQTALLEYGVTPELITALKTTVDDYRAQVDAPKEGTTERKQVTDQLAAMVETQTEVLERLDALYELLRYSQPAIYDEYQDTRRIIYRSGTLSAKCEVKDAETGLALAGANVAFSQNDGLIFEKKTSVAGGLNIKSLDEGTYTVTVSRLGYQTQTLTVHVLDMEMNILKVALMKE